ESRKNGSSREPGIKAPANVAASTAAAPRSDASRILPLRRRYMYQPTKRAIGIVQAMVNVPQELPGTRRRVSGGSSKPFAVGSDLNGAPGGIARLKPSWKTMDCPASGPKW